MTPLQTDPRWRLENYYHIIDKSGKAQLFKMNWAQLDLYANMWYCNVILKARQLGISTFICLLFLDRCLFNDNKAAGIIAHTREDAEHLFKRIKYAYDKLPPSIKAARPATSDSARELVFSNGSSIRVGTSMRGSTLQYLHISEFGKICAKYPDKAEEIITGSLNTVAPGQYVFIESTAEGKEGYFYDMCKKAQDDKNQRKDLSELDFRFHFFPWHKEPSYRIGSQVTIDQDTIEYFSHLKNVGIHLDSEQAFWYALKAYTQGDNMMREYPSTPEEAWQTSIDGTYYGKQMALARSEGRVAFIPYDESALVHTAWDLGYNDNTAIWFFQMIGKEIHLIEFIQGSGESLSHWLKIVQKKEYAYGSHIAPHDILAHEYTSGMTRQESARKMGIHFVPAPKMDIIGGIDQVRGILNRCFFDEKNTSSGLKCLENYKKDWNEKLGTWMSKPRHDLYSHGADAMRTLATGLHYIADTSHTNIRRKTLGDIRPHDFRGDQGFRRF